MKIKIERTKTRLGVADVAMVFVYDEVRKDYIYSASYYSDKDAGSFKAKKLDFYNDDDVIKKYN